MGQKRETKQNGKNELQKEKDAQKRKKNRRKRALWKREKRQKKRKERERTTSSVLFYCCLPCPVYVYSFTHFCIVFCSRFCYSVSFMLMYMKHYLLYHDFIAYRPSILTPRHHFTASSRTYHPFKISSQPILSRNSTPIFTPL